MSENQTAFETYQEAIKMGLRPAIRNQANGIENALKKWYEQHPDFASLNMKAKLVEGLGQLIQQQKS